MQIFTSYFANIKNLSKDFIPVSIALKTPIWFSGVRYMPLAPTGEILSGWKLHQNSKLYVHEYNKHVLSRLNPVHVRKDLEKLSGGKDVVLLCYEKPDDFCHRHLVAEWLSSYGIPVSEWKTEKEREAEWEQMSFLC